MPGTRARVRPASPLDAAGCLAIYRPYVENSAVSWELDVPPISEMAERITAACDTHAWLVLEHDEQITGFAYAHAFNRLPTYRWSAQTGIYVDGDHHRRGGGREMYAQLLNRLGERGYRQVLAGITQPNEASNGFHRSLGFREAGLYRRVEWKLDRWHDVAWMQRDLPGAADNEDPAGSIL
jgi:L-amino acid N-acyltransferase YncA